MCRYIWPIISGGAKVFAARGKHLCCRPCQSVQFCNQAIFQDFGHGCKPTLGGPLLFSPLSFPLFPSHSPIPCSNHHHHHLFLENGICEIRLPLKLGVSVTRGNSCKLVKTSCNTNAAKYFYTNRIVFAWNSVSDTVVTASSANAFRKHLTLLI